MRQAVCPVLSGPLDHESVLATAPVSNGVSVKSEVRADADGHAWSYSQQGARRRPGAYDGLLS